MASIVTWLAMTNGNLSSNRYPWNDLNQVSFATPAIFYRIVSINRLYIPAEPKKVSCKYNFALKRHCNYASLCGFIYYLVALIAQVWCTIVLWACGIQAEYMCVCSTHNQGLVSQQILFQQYRPYDIKCIELDSHLSIYTMFVLGIFNAIMNLKQFGLLVLIM